LNAAPDPLLGRVLAQRYQLLAQIGEGGMGIVYKGMMLGNNFPVAVKVLAPHLTSDPAWVSRFKVEAEAISKLSSPNTVKLVDYGLAPDGTLFIAMEFLAGKPLSALLEKQKKFRPDRALRIIVQCLSSLGEAHAIGIVHRDVKPDNIFVDEQNGDFVKVLDFSVAKDYGSANAQQTRAGLVLGTPQYMSPEQGRGLPQDARTDLYGLGVLLYEMLAGTVPFNSDSPMEVLAAHVSKPPPPLKGVADPIARIVMRALEKEPNRRFQSAGEMSAECQQALGGPISAPVQMSAAAAVPSGYALAAPQDQTISPATAVPPDAPTYSPGQQPRPVPTPPSGRPAMRMPSGPAPAARPAPKSDTLFWLAWVGAGLLVGVVAYIIVLKLQH
jgi:serine/threonine-protein kinase